MFSKFFFGVSIVLYLIYTIFYSLIIFGSNYFELGIIARIERLSGYFFGFLFGLLVFLLIKQLVSLHFVKKPLFLNEFIKKLGICFLWFIAIWVLFEFVIFNIFGYLMNLYVLRFVLLHSFPIIPLFYYAKYFEVFKTNIREN